MKPTSILGWVSGAALLGFCAAQTLAPPARSESGLLVRNGEIGFVVTKLQYGLARNASAKQACPNGFSRSFRENYEKKHPPKDSPAGKAESAYGGRLFYEAMKAPDGSNLCLKPELATDPSARTVVRRDIEVYGIDLDGRSARANAPPAPGTCAHDDFLDSRGSANIDNQYYRVVGCTRGFLPGGLGERLDSEMLEGAWTIVIAVKGVENLRNDPNVEVSISAGADPIQLSPTGKALPYATYVMVADQKFRATTKGRIVNGILYSNPVNVRFHFSANGKRFERSLNAGRLRLHLHSAADAESYLSGYTSIADLYKNEIGFDGSTFIAGASADAIGYTCNGMYSNLVRYADGDRDPRTGRCTSISTQYRITAVPAFVVEPQLDKGGAS
jgi:hypothetical protein